MGLKALRSFEEMEQVLAEAAGFSNEKSRIDFLSSHYLNLEGGFDFPKDPFSDAYYHRVMELYQRFSNRQNYNPADHELSGFTQDIDIRSPAPYYIQSGDLIGNMMICWGFIMRTLDLKPGMSLLEYGPGTGQILLHFARMGVRASGIDIDPVQVRVILEQSRRLNLDIRAKVGQFGDTIEPGEEYDAVLFFEAFHHSLNHIALVDRLQEIVSHDGVFVVAGEPILAPNNHYRPVVPFPWGPRLDLLSQRAARVHGWMELGFQEEYFVKLMHRAGWIVSKHHCPATELATMYVSRKNHGKVGVGELFLPVDEEATWYGPEGPNRWTRGHALLTCDSRSRWSRIAVNVTNYNPHTIPVTLACGQCRRTTNLAPGQTLPLTIPLPGGTRLLEIQSPTFCPSRMGINEDTRELGVYVGEISYS